MDGDEKMSNDRSDDALDWLKEQAVMQQASSSGIFQEQPAAHLPPEVWERVFLHLKARNELLSVRLVCHHWRNIVDRCPSLITKILLKFPPSLTVDEQYVPENLFPARRALFLRANISTLGFWWPSVGQRLSNLLLYHCDVAFPALVGLLRETPNLKQFTMAYGFCSGLRENSEIDFRLDRLEQLKLRPIQSSVPEVVDFFRRIGPKLKEFEFFATTYQTGLEERVIQLIRNVQGTLQSVTLGMHGFNTFLKELSAMERLHLKTVGLMSEKSAVDHQKLLNFCCAQPSIEVLELNCFKLAYKTLYAIGTALPVLKDFRIIVVLPDDEVTMFPTYLNSMPGLEHLSIHVLNCMNSQRIDFGSCNVRNSKELHMAELQPTAEGMQNHFITSANIHKFTLKRCHLNSWTDIFALPQLKCLQYLELQETSVTSSNDELELGGLDNLKYLKFDIFRSSKSEFVKLFSLCPNLEQIHVHGTNIDDEVTLAMCRQLSQLSSITFENCAIGDISMEYIRTHCCRLRKIEIYNCPSLTDAAVSILQSMENIQVKIR